MDFTKTNVLKKYNSGVDTTYGYGGGDSKYELMNTDFEQSYNSNVVHVLKDDDADRGASREVEFRSGEFQNFRHSTAHPSSMHPSEFSTISELAGHSIPPSPVSNPASKPPPSPFQKISPATISTMSKENLLKYLCLSSSHLSRLDLVEAALKKHRQATRDVITSSEDYAGSIRSVERTHVGASALYNIDPAILQTFADALTPNKTNEIKQLRLQLQESVSSLESLEREVVSLQKFQKELSSANTRLKGENRELNIRLSDTTTKLRDFSHHKAEMKNYLEAHTEFFSTVKSTFNGLFVQDTLYNTTVNKLEEETQHRQRLELKLVDTTQQLKDAHAKLKSKEKVEEVQKDELEKLRATVSRNQKLLKEYDNVTELSKMKNELRKMREKTMNLNNMQNVLQNQRVKYFELQKNYKELEIQHDRLKALLADTNSHNDELRIKLIREKDMKVQNNDPKASSDVQQAARTAVKRDPKHNGSNRKQKAKQVKFLEGRIKQAEKFALMKKNDVPLNAEQEGLLLNVESLRAQLKDLQRVNG